MKNAIRPALTVCFLALASQVSAAELKGAEVVQALNGQSFDCKFRGGSMVWSFASANPAGPDFPFTVTMNGKTAQLGYKLHKNGTMRAASTNASRKIVRNKDGSLTVSGAGAPKTTCVRR